MKNQATTPCRDPRAAHDIPAAFVELPGEGRIWMLDRPTVDGPEGLPLVLLHGYLDSHYSFSRILPFLPRTCRIVAPDLRGHGRSFRPRSGYDMTDMAADVLALLDTLGIRSAVVVGHSMGSFVAQRLAAMAGERIRALVLVSSAPSVHAMPGLADLEREIADLRDPVPAEFVRAFQESTIAGGVPLEFMDRVVAESLLVPAMTMRAVFAGMIGAPPLEAGRIAAPILLQWGTADALFDRDQQERLRGLARVVRLREYPGVGHAPHWERPVQIAADIRDFLSMVPDLKE